MVAAQQQQPVFLRDRAIVVLLDRQRDRLDGLRPARCRAAWRRASHLVVFGRRDLGQRLRGRAARGDQRQRLGRFHVGGVVGARAVDQRVLAGAGDHVELVRAGAADRAVVGRDRAELQAEAGEDADVGVEHGLVRLLHAVDVAVEGVGILHGELAAAHQAEARTALVAELGLDVIEVQRQLAVRLDLGAHDVGHHFFRGRLQREVAAVAVLQAQQFRPHLVPAAGLLPQFGRLHQRHQQLDRAGLVHFFADDGLDLADHAQAQRHVGIDAGTEALDHPGPHHQLVADDLGVGRRFFER